MNISINENFEQYRREFWKGLTLKQTLYAAAGVAVGFSSYCVTTFALGIPLEVSTWIALLASLPVILIGFVQVQGMPLLTWMRRMANVRGSTYTYKCDFLLAEAEEREERTRKANAKGRNEDRKEKGRRERACFLSPDSL